MHGAVRRQVAAGKKGKTVTVVDGFDPGGPDAAADVLKKFKRVLGAGGSLASNGAMSFQGDRAATLVEMRHAWMLQRPLFEYAALTSAPSRSLELRAVDQWLGRVGVLEAFCAVNPKVRLHRASSLPQAEDVFTPELAPGGIVFRF